MHKTVTQLEFCLENERATVDWGAQLAAVVQQALNGSLAGAALSIYLQGDLGAGKTTLCRGIVQGCGHCGAVKSPTYTLVEPYELGSVSIYHFDLYRLESDAELDFIGVDNYFYQPATICVFEWPERAQAALPAADLILSLTDYTCSEQATLPQVASDPYARGRKLHCLAASSNGTVLLQNMATLCSA